MESTLVVSRWQAWALQCALWNPRSWQLASRYLHVPFPRHSGVWFRSFGNSCFSKRETGVSCLLLAFSELGRTSCSAWGSVAGWRFPLLFRWSHGNLWAGASSHDHLLSSCLEGHIRQAVVSKAPCAHAPSLSPPYRNTKLSITTAVSHPCSLQGAIWEGSSFLLGHSWVWRIAEVLVLIGICPPSLVADFQSTIVISHPRAKGTT